MASQYPIVTILEHAIHHLVKAYELQEDGAPGDAMRHYDHAAGMLLTVGINITDLELPEVPLT